MRIRLIALAALALLLAGCGFRSIILGRAPDEPPVAFLDGGVPRDLGGDQGRSECALDADCDDGLRCTGEEACRAGACVVAVPPPPCDDGIACTDDVCDEADGCAFMPNDALCTGDLACDPSRGCVRTECVEDADCEDGLICNGTGRCADGGFCVWGPPPDCRDDIFCTDARCDEEAGGCIRIAVPRRCDDGVTCNGQEVCDVMVGCVPGEPVVCEPSVSCFEAFCDEFLGCVELRADRDGDGIAGTACGGGDCNDDNPDIRPDNGEDCSNGIDDDCDLLTDCSDFFSCRGSPACRGCSVERCDNGVDDDCDGVVDCDDSDCALEIGNACCEVTGPEDCLTFIDEDCDGFAGCDDVDCAMTDRCLFACVDRELRCSDGVDDDCDDEIDCDDPECAGSPDCP